MLRVQAGFRPSSFRLLPVVFPAALSQGPGCSDSSSSRVCDPGATQACVCANGQPGAQVCADDGSRWSACNCSGSGDGGIQMGDMGTGSFCSPACSSGSCCGGVCVDLSSDPANCGTCGHACGSGEICRAGQCVTCSPNCDGKDCGDDGCGGSCGTCPSGQVCEVSACVVCVPDCDNKECGDDGCGGSCGSCAEGMVCVAGSCTDECTPNCTGKLCGDDDGCGGKCQGACPGGGTCSNGVCVGGCTPNCEGRECGNDGCGGSCGECGEGEVCLKHQCRQDPLVVGCSDGTREGFQNMDLYPDLAGCQASWPTQSLRATGNGQPCGNDYGECFAPEDACAPGWHICMKQGWPGDITTRVSPEDCRGSQAGHGVFVAASDCIGDALPLGCGRLLRVVACGLEADAYCPGTDDWTGCSESIACYEAYSTNVTGVLCCRNPEVVGQ